MNEKWQRAIELVDEGRTNAEINATLREEYGSGVATRKFGEWRQGTKARKLAAEREAEREAKAARGEARRELAAKKRALVREVMSAGGTGYAANKACKEQLGGSVGNEVLLAVKAELEAEGQNLDPEDAIEAVALPPEMLHEDPEDLLEPVEGGNDLVVHAPHGPNGTLKNMKALQAWMQDIDAVELHLTREGKLSVLARHEFDIGGIE